VSYGVYVMHPFLIHTIETHRGTAPGVRLFVLTAASTLALAAATWYAAERPILRLNRFWPMPRASSEADQTRIAHIA
jgi:peptidoglycan/LPS O-acetylase OafA/YrhL